MEYIYSHKSKEHIHYIFAMKSHPASFLFNNFHSDKSDIK